MNLNLTEQMEQHRAEEEFLDARIAAKTVNPHPVPLLRGEGEGKAAEVTCCALDPIEMGGVLIERKNGKFIISLETDGRRGGDLTGGTTPDERLND